MNIARIIDVEICANKWPSTENTNIDMRLK